MADSKMLRLREETWTRLTQQRGKVMANGETWIYDRLVVAMLDVVEHRLTPDANLLLEVNGTIVLEE